MFVEDMPQESLYVKKTGAIIVLTGGRNRIAKGLELLARKKAGRLMISGVQKGASLEDIIRMSGYKKFVNKKRITLDYQSMTTVDNAKNVAKWVQYSNIRSIRLVTANYHMRRALIEFNRYMKNVKILDHAVDPLGSKNRLWHKNYGIFWLYLNEYHKYLGAYMRMKISHLYQRKYKT